MLAVCTSGPDVPVNVSVHVRFLAVRGTVTVAVILAAPLSVAEDGLILHVVSAGQPEHFVVTVPVNPPDSLSRNQDDC